MECIQCAGSATGIGVVCNRLKFPSAILEALLSILPLVFLLFTIEFIVPLGIYVYQGTLTSRYLLLFNWGLHKTNKL